MSEVDRIDESLLETDSESEDFLSGSSSDEEDQDMDADGLEEGMEEEATEGAAGGIQVSGKKNNNNNGHHDEDEDEGMGAEAPTTSSSSSSGQVKRRTYIPGVKVNDGDDTNDLDFDESAYLMYHRAECGYPCLSFDVIPDSLGSNEERATSYPQTVYLVAGTQAPKLSANKLLVMKMSNLTRMKPKKNKNEEDDEDSESDDDDDEDPENDPRLLCAQIPHDGAVNRVRTMTLGSTQVAASWSETGRVNVWDLTKQLQAVEDEKTNDLFKKLRTLPKPIFSFIGHKAEGYAMDWSVVNKGYLATGDQNKKIFIWKPLEAFSWHVDQHPLTGHEDSVEDIQWSPNEENILVSCSVDKSIRIWDIRSDQKTANVLTIPSAHDSDVNVISWNKKQSPFLLSGGDDGAIKTWDMRQFGKTVPTPIAVFKHHTAPITSIEWHPTDSSVFAASGEDNQITLWDLAVEKDEEEEGVGSGSSSKDDEEDEEEKAQLDQLPPQLLFIHQGSNEVKELHWHQQIPGLVISTAVSGFDVFRTISV